MSLSLNFIAPITLSLKYLRIGVVQMKSFIWRFCAGLCTVILVVGCGADDSSDLSNVDSDAIQISGAGIKGPLAFADVKIYKLDPSFPDYYDRTSPISIAITNQYAEINGLSVPRKIKRFISAIFINSVPA